MMYQWSEWERYKIMCMGESNVRRAIVIIIKVIKRERDAR